jgi:diguanylate cyclase (GGDEF)-like protein
MMSRFSAVYAIGHLLLGIGLLLWAMIESREVPVIALAVATLLFAGMLVRGGERFAKLHLQHSPFKLRLLLLLDCLLYAAVLAVFPAADVLWVAVLLTFMLSAEYGKFFGLIGSGFMTLISSLLWLLDPASFAPLSPLEISLYFVAMFAVAFLLGDKVDAQFEESYVDSLCKLPNRTQFMRRLSHRLHNDREKSQLLGVLVLDIQRFRRINENLGYGFGDQVLHAVARRLSVFAETENLHVARLESDKFIMLLEQAADAGALETLARRLIAQFEQPWRLFEHEIELHVFAGLTIYPQKSHHAHALVEQALTALYRAKQRRTPLVTYSVENNSSFTERYVIEAGMRKALERNEFVVYYQPKVNIQSGAVMGIEALVRWNHPELGLLPPNKFIHIAEENGLIIELGEWILQTACRQHAVWLAQGQPPIRICVNVSLKQLEDPGYHDTLQRVLANSGLAPQHLELEITESLALKNIGTMQKVLTRLAKLGIKLTIDDFGTGYASYKHLSHLPIHALKIDKSFMRGINQNPDAEAIVTSIIQLAKSLQLTVTAEGVETFEQLVFLKRLSCDEVQGYLYMQPEPANIFEPCLKRGFAHVSQLF